MRVVILGAGVAGLAVGHALASRGHSDYLILERASQPGGMLRPLKVAGIPLNMVALRVAARGPSRELLLGAGGRIAPLGTATYFRGETIAYPFQLGLGRQPLLTRLRIVWELIQAWWHNRHGGEECEDFSSWARSRFGSWIAEQLVLPHSHKSWTVPGEEIVAAALSKKVPPVSYSDMIGCTLRLHTPRPIEVVEMPYGVHQVADTLLQGQIGKGGLWTGAVVRGVDLVHREVIFETEAYGRQWGAGGGASGVGVVSFDGKFKVGYDVLVNTLPLPLFTKMCCPVPMNVQDAAQVLRSNALVSSVFVYPVGSAGTAPYRFVLFPESQYLFQRVHFPEYYGTATGGRCVLVTETSLTPDRAKMLRENETYRRWFMCRQQDQLFAVGAAPRPQAEKNEYHILEPAYPLSDRSTVWALGLVRAHLEGHNVSLFGRFAEWTGLEIDSAIEQASVLADRLLKGVVHDT